jgi:hypothetical protein
MNTAWVRQKIPAHVVSISKGLKHYLD